MSEKETFRVAADIPEDSRLAAAIRNEQEATGRNVTDIVRDALVARYEDVLLEALGVKVVS